MEPKQNKKVYGREELKQYFRNGRMPSENHFGYLIDSTINKQEDGFSKDEENGLQISALGASKRLLSFYRATDDLEPFFFVEKDEYEYPALRLQPYHTAPDVKEQDNNSFFFHTDGKLGIGKKCDPDFKVDIKGFAAMEGRIGSYKVGTVPADGKWHPVLEELDNCHAFEVVARTGLKHAGRHAMMHAYALSTFGGSRNKIRQSCAYYGFAGTRSSCAGRAVHMTISCRYAQTVITVWALISITVSPGSGPMRYSCPTATTIKI